MGRYIPKQELSVGNEDNVPNIDENEQPVMWSDDLETPEEVFELESDGEHENAVQNIETLEEAQQSLESLREALISVGVENFNKGSVILLDNGVNQILNKFDLSASDIGIASVEDVTYDPIEAYNASMESIGKTLKAVGSKIIEWLLQKLKNLVNGFRGIFSMVIRHQNKTRKLMEAGKNTKEQANETIKVYNKNKEIVDVNAIKSVIDFIKKYDKSKELSTLYKSIFQNIEKGDIDAADEDVD